MRVGLEGDRLLCAQRSRLTNIAARVRKHALIRVVQHRFNTRLAIIDNSVFPRHSLVTVLLASGKETKVQPTITRLNGRHRMAAKKKASKKAPAKKKSASKRKPNAAFMKAMQPSASLGAVIGNNPMPRTEVTKKIWVYIKKNGLQDSKNRRNINADEKLRDVFGGKKQVSMFEMTKLVNKHLK
jgi:type IV secretory pathway VirB10-like protein